MTQEIKKSVKEYWQMEKEHKKGSNYTCKNGKYLSDYAHFMFADFLFDKMDLWSKKIDRRKFEQYCYELLKQGENFLRKNAR